VLGENARERKCQKPAVQQTTEEEVLAIAVVNNGGLNCYQSTYYTSALWEFPIFWGVCFIYWPYVLGNSTMFWSFYFLLLKYSMIDFVQCFCFIISSYGVFMLYYSVFVLYLYVVIVLWRNEMIWNDIYEWHSQFPVWFCTAAKYTLYFYWTVLSLACVIDSEMLSEWCYILHIIVLNSIHYVPYVIIWLCLPWHLPVFTS